MRLAVVGSRSFNDYELLNETLSSQSDIDEIVSGGARGADSMAERWADDNGIPKQIFPADWSNLNHPDALIREKYGRKYDARAGFRRNQLIVDYADALIAFRNSGTSNGTDDVVEKARLKGIPVEIIEYEQSESDV